MKKNVYIAIVINALSKMALVVITSSNVYYLNMPGLRSRACGTSPISHNINVMHTEKNIAEAIFGTIMDIPDKTMDNVKARVNQARLCNRPKLDMAPPGGGKSWIKPKADFVLTRAQRREVLEWFQTLMFPDGYAANLKRGVNLDTLRINGSRVMTTTYGLSGYYR